ncbi:MAG: hypothetical protein DIZ80_14525 [endosymbiont of Galathealinum brachiosum]|uniref:histidine kinase n=1 Tax=endosymbiont of Galathealinum brachiosum TaxID=2200906 RepID=A0A370D8T1_9GAMM|nr:MAG: hypothetical protein DIZ80_14525 [endosymbiont of Galathealinum brachiosum]
MTNQGDEITWRALKQLNLYRLVLATGLLAAFNNSEWMIFLGSQSPEAFVFTASIMLIGGLLYVVTGLRGRPNFETQIVITNASDILLITLLSHFSGGLSSSLSVLLIINVTATGTFLRDRDSFLFAALASIAVLSEQTYSMAQGISNAAEYTRAGLLGLVFFGTSFLASILSKRARESEKLAIEREADIISLEILNEDIIQNMRTGIIVVDIDGHIRLANSSAEALLGNISLQDNPLLENILPALDARFLQWQEQPYTHHKAIRQEHGLPDIQPGFRKLQRTEHETTDDDSGGTSDTLIFLEDATQLNQRFQQIKLASLGRLTASIAHEIRNPLSAINHAAQLLDEGNLSPGDKKLSSIITTQVQRLDKVIENVLQLSRQQQGNIETIELKRWLQYFCDDFLQTNKLGKDQLQLDILLDEVIILFDSSHLTQVMCNLCTNAIVHNDKALEKIKIIIRCGHDKKYDQPFIEIIDNGPEIPKKIVQQIFDPFFTTSTKGTGLGLYITKEMIESNRGKIIYTKSGDGENCFKLLFISRK